MELIPDSTRLTSRTNVNTCARHNDHTTGRSEIQEHAPLLYKIAISFGFVDSETRNLVQQVCTCADIEENGRHVPALLKIRLAKRMVHRCIFKISSQLFSQHREEPKISYPASPYDSGKTGLRKQDMPLSLRSVYLLHHVVGFNEGEIAEMLNTTPLQVKQKLSKALQYINHPHGF